MLVSMQDIRKQVKEHITARSYRAAQNASFALLYGSNPQTIQVQNHEEGWRESLRILVEAMQAGPVISPEGQIIDGQHRLHAHQRAIIDEARRRVAPPELSERRARELSNTSGMSNPCAEIPLEGWNFTTLRWSTADDMGTGRPLSNYIDPVQYKYIGGQIALWIAQQLKHETDAKLLIGAMTKGFNKKRYSAAMKKASPGRVVRTIGLFYQKQTMNAWMNFHMLYNEIRSQMPGQVFKAWDENFINFLSALLFDAVGFGLTTLNNKWRTEKVMGLIRNMKDTLDFTLMPMLADALEDDGFPHQEYLRWLRHGTHSKASWIFRATGCL